MKTTNQLNNPKKHPKDAQGNIRKRLYFKSGGASILFCKDITKEGAKAFERNVQMWMKNLNTKLEGTFICVQ